MLKNRQSSSRLLGSEKIISVPVGPKNKLSSEGPKNILSYGVLENI